MCDSDCSRSFSVFWAISRVNVVLKFPLARWKCFIYNPSDVYVIQGRLSLRYEKIESLLFSKPIFIFNINDSNQYYKKVAKTGF